MTVSQKRGKNQALADLGRLYSQEDRNTLYARYRIRIFCLTSGNMIIGTHTQNLNNVCFVSLRFWYLIIGFLSIVIKFLSVQWNLSRPCSRHPHMVRLRRQPWVVKSADQVSVDCSTFLLRFRLHIASTHFTFPVFLSEVCEPHICTLRHAITGLRLRNLSHYTFWLLSLC